jgi:hypothetical protein
MSGNATDSAGPSGDDMLDPDAAAERLGVTADVLRGWSERLAFPTAIGERPSIRYRRAEIEALRYALASAHSVEGAVQAAQRALEH